jgi:hypothetical protein
MANHPAGYRIPGTACCTRTLPPAGSSPAPPIRSVAGMNDDYRITSAPESGPTGRLRPFLWVVLILSAATNAVLSGMTNPFVCSAFGLVALICAVALIVHHYRNRQAAQDR